jgi:hypothetical protein
MSTILTLILAMAMQAPSSPNVRVIAQETMSQVEEFREAVARTDAEWKELWRQHAGAAKLPSVDLKTRTVVAVFLGTRSSAGYAAEIVGIKESEGALIVEWGERRPKGDEVAAQVLTSPAVIASVPKFAGEIKFVRVTR